MGSEADPRMMGCKVPGPGARNGARRTWPEAWNTRVAVRELSAASPPPPRPLLAVRSGSRSRACCFFP